MAGEFEKALPFKWRDAHYPVTKVSLSLAHDLVEHKYWGVNGARVEDTGVAPVRISVVIPIANTIFPGKKEQWLAGGLYPTALRQFIVDFGKRQTAYIQHPEFGEIACKPERMEFELAGDKQDCTEIHASWVETLDDALVHRVTEAPAQDIDLALVDLEASRLDLRDLAPKLPEFQDDLESLGRRLTSVVDSATVLVYRATGLVNRVIYQAHRLEVAIERAATDPTTKITQLRPFASYDPFGSTLRRANPQRPPRAQKQHALTWPAVEALQRVTASSFSLRQQLLTLSNGVGLYTVPDDTTVGGLMVSLPKGTSVANVIRMNPDLARTPIVSKGVVVRYPLS